jgi:nodulation protein E
MMRRVAVTGLGAVSAFGSGVAPLWSAASEGRSGIRPLSGLPPDAVRFPNAAQFLGYEAGEHFDSKQLPLMDRFAQFALLAAREAASDAAPAWTPELRARTAVVIGSSIGGQHAQDSGFEEIYAQGKPRIHPYTIPRIMPSSAPSHISMEMGLTGPSWCVSTACASANHAIGQAYWMIRSGAADMALAGGAECPFSLGFLKAWDALRVVSSDTCRPFSSGRKGLVLGEGAGCLVIEPLEAALARGARVYCEIVGFGMSSDAGHITQPSESGAAAAIRAALADGRIAPERVNHVNAHGTGTPINDPVETAALRAVFGEQIPRIAVSATKSVHGHALGAAGGLEAVICACSIRENLLPPIANFLERDEACDLDLVVGSARTREVDIAISNSFAFGGLNAVLAFAAGR